VHHSLLDDPQIQRALTAAARGDFGQITSVELVRGATYPAYEGGPLPPHYRTAGYAFAEYGAPCLTVIQELLGPIVDVEAGWRSAGGDPNLPFDDWRVSVRCERGTGTVQLTWAPKPPASSIVIRGSRGEQRIDLGKRTIDSVVDAIKQRLHRAPEPSEVPLISVEDTAAVALFVDQVTARVDAEHRARLATFALSERVPFLVTGASGKVGHALVARLVAAGHRVRAMLRRVPEEREANVEYAFGDLGDPEAVDRAVTGVETVIHIGAATKGGWPEHRVGTVVGTRNVIDACRKHGVRQLVYLSSMSVIDWAGSVGSGPITEGAQLEPRPEERGPYTRAKLEAERLVVAAARQHGLPCVILRPGQIFGGGIPLINGAVARHAAGRWLVLGDGELELPLVFLDDVIDAIVAAIDKQLVGAEVIQIIDPDHLTQREVLALAGDGKPVIALPRPLVFALGKLSELPMRAVGKQSPVAAYRLQSALARLHYESDRARSLLGWQPRVGVREGIRRVTP